MVRFESIARGVYRPAQLKVHYDPTLRMPITPQIQTWIDNLWQEKLNMARQRGTRLFEAPLFRLIDAQSQADGTLDLFLGDTSYKEYVTTRVPEFAQEHVREQLGNALGVCSVVETSDQYILLDKREGVDVYVGRYHVIGGFFERHLDTNAETKQPDPFASMRREIREETGIRADDISEQYCLGVVYDQETPHGELCFLMQLHIPLEEVLKRQPDDDEIKQLHTLKISEESLRDFIVNNHGNISTTGEANLLLYGAWKFGEEWLVEVTKRL